MITKSEAIYNAFCEVVPYTKDEVTVQVDGGEDEYGTYIRVHHDGKISSKYHYETDKV